MTCSLSADRPVTTLTVAETISYAVPAAGAFFFYIPMWSILPGVYAKYFGIPLTSIAAVVLFIRVFDGIIVPTIGYLSDRRRSAGGSRKPWVIAGYVGVIFACQGLFNPPHPVTTAYYLVWSMLYFFATTVGDIPHCAWGSELTLDYQQRAQVFGMRNVMSRLGIIAFYAMPLLPIYATSDYTPQVLHDGVYVGAALTAVGLVWALLAAPAGIATETVREDSLRLFLHSLLHNKPLMLYFSAYACMGLCYGMWFGLLYFYLDSYLGLGGKVAMMFLVGFALAALSTPLWLNLIRKTSKSTTWATGAVLFCLQMIGTWFVTPATNWWIPFFLLIIANLNFCCNDVAAMSILGDIADYGKLKFHRDRSSTYFAFNTLVFQVGLGIGGGVAIGIAGLYGFVPSAAAHSAASIFGLKLGYVVAPTCLACMGLMFILRTPINRRRHRTIQRRLESRVVRRAARITVQRY